MTTIKSPTSSTVASTSCLLRRAKKGPEAIRLRSEGHNVRCGPAYRTVTLCPYGTNNSGPSGPPSQSPKPLGRSVIHILGMDDEPVNCDGLDTPHRRRPCPGYPTRRRPAEDIGAYQGFDGIRYAVPAPQSSSDR